MKNRADRFAGPWLGLCAVFPFLLFLPLGANAQHEHDTHERCGQRSALANLVAQRPELLYELEAYQRAIPELVESGGAFPRSGAVLVIPVVFHVIHSGQAVGNGPNLSDARIQQQIAQTNLDYRRQNSDAANTPALFQNIVGDMEIEFCLATVDPNGNPTSGITRHSYNIANQNTIDYTIKGQTNWDPTRYLNVWTVSMPNDLNGVLGYAYPPLTSIVGTDLDGVVLNYLHTGVNAAANPDSEGRTFTHEVGHYLGLPHPWSDINGNGGCVVDDGINDTPQSDDAFYGCPGFPQFSCGNSAMFMNFMDYVDDDCMNSFTLGQKAVMRAVLQGNTVHNGANYRGRASVLANAVTACSIVDPGACLYLPFTPMQMGFEAGQSTAAWTIENTNGDQNNNQPVTWAAATNPQQWRLWAKQWQRFCTLLLQYQRHHRCQRLAVHTLFRGRGPAHLSAQFLVCLRLQRRNCLSRAAESRARHGGRLRLGLHRAGRLSQCQQRLSGLHRCRTGLHDQRQRRDLSGFSGLQCCRPVCPATRRHWTRGHHAGSGDRGH